MTRNEAKIDYDTFIHSVATLATQLDELSSHDDELLANVLARVLYARCYDETHKTCCDAKRFRAILAFIEREAINLDVLSAR